MFYDGGAYRKQENCNQFRSEGVSSPVLKKLASLVNCENCSDFTRPLKHIKYNILRIQKTNGLP